ncbi:Clp protease N-terminal domain-containing protein [Streptomonospora wellingtoniae]|uniref:Clp protease N-terminal domain-containing protein n=1 Tax=Streptomonospora wellingtoniae TaxID=3075544 RepID=A0ABU2KZT0_9ACTN|nr:Clp protease N-terminal domain-containing protein [Streptomonospora sp. DSM 45055]MDT0304773.1 Clp protease N-terminal domain-containing protein [Streptomonospora sp. DSM 45055]
MRHSHEEVRATGHERIGTEHLLLAVLAEPTGAGHRALHQHGADAASLRDAVRLLAAPKPADTAAAPGEARRLGHGLLQRLHDSVGGGRTRLSPRAKKALEQSLRAALENNDKSINSGHVLLGILRVPDATAHRILAGAAIDPQALRTTATAFAGGGGSTA